MSDTKPTLAPWRLRLVDCKALIALEIAAVFAVFVAYQHYHIYFSKTLYLLALGWLSIAVRGVRWQDLGLRIGPGWRRHLLFGFAAGLAIEALELCVTQPLLVKLTGKLPDLSVFHFLIGNVRMLLLSIWVVLVRNRAGRRTCLARIFIEPYC